MDDADTRLPTLIIKAESHELRTDIHEKRSQAGPSDIML